MKTLIKFLTVIGLVISSTAFAHVKLDSSVPADNAMLMSSPKELSLKFTKPVRVVKVSLKSKKGQKVDFNFKPSKQQGTEHNWALPKLKPANYIVNVTFLGADGHKMKHSLGFMVH